MLFSTPESAFRRACDYWNIDGFAEMLWSLMLLLLGFWTLASKVPGPSWFPRLADIALIMTLLYSFLCRKALEWLKARLTYPHTGYTPPPLTRDEIEDARWQAVSIGTGLPQPGRARMALWLSRQERALPAGLLGFVLLAGMGSWPFRWLPLVLTTAAALAFRSAKGHPEFPFHSIALWSLPVAGLILSVLDVPAPARVGWALLAFSIVGFIVGAITCWRFLRQNPLPAKLSCAKLS